MPARKVAAILDDSPSLTALAAVARRTSELQRVYLVAVPAELSKASRVGWARAGVLCIATGNGAVAAKLRQLAPRILNYFRQQGHEFNAMRVEVQVSMSLGEIQESGTKPLSQKALASIRTAAQSVADSPLKAALARLGQRDTGIHKARSKT